MRALPRLGPRWARRLGRRRPGGQRAPGSAELTAVSEEDRRWLSTLHDDTVALPAHTAQALRDDHPRLVELRRRYADLDLPVLAASRWTPSAVRGFLDLPWFRGETLITWHYRELPRISALKYFLYAEYVTRRDKLGLLRTLDEDGLFGCWTYDYPGHPLYSRDLLDSVNELAFLGRHLDLGPHRQTAVLDIGAGYGRLAHRMTSADLGVSDYCCVDAVAESTFLSEFYLAFRGCSPPARVVTLDAIEATLKAGAFDLAVNVHSWSECTYPAVAWWIDLLARLGVPRLLLVPNEATELLTLEGDGSRRDFAPLLAAAGYRLSHREPVIDDPAVRELMRLDDHFHLFVAD